MKPNNKINNPLISIVTVSLNADNILGKTIDSIINQSYDKIEYIIIDGGSIDKTTDIIKKYSNHIKYWISEKDSGLFNSILTLFFLDYFILTSFSCLIKNKYEGNN